MSELQYRLKRSSLSFAGICAERARRKSLSSFTSLLAEMQKECRLEIPVKTDRFHLIFVALRLCTSVQFFFETGLATCRRAKIRIG